MLYLSGTGEPRGKERVLGCEPATCLRRACPTCGARAPRRCGLPVSDEAGVGLLGLLEPSSFSVPHNAAVIGMRPAWSAPFRRRLTGEQFNVPKFGLQQGGACPSVVLCFGQQMPSKDGKLTRRSHGGHLLAPAALYPHEERA